MAKVATKVAGKVGKVAGKSTKPAKVGKVAEKPEKPRSFKLIEKNIGAGISLPEGEKGIVRGYDENGFVKVKPILGRDENGNPTFSKGRARLIPASELAWVISTKTGKGRWVYRPANKKAA